MNNFQFRDNIPYAVKIQKGKRRITIIGDSFSTGHGIKKVENRFANILRKKFPDAEIHVAALNGLNSQTELNSLKTMQARGYEFDIIILAYCLNDIDYLVPKSLEIDTRIKSFNSQLSFLEKNSYFINTFSFRYFASQDPDFMSYSNFVLDGYENDESWEYHKSTLRGIKKFTQDLNKPLVVVTFPFLQEKIENYTFLEAHKKLNAFWKNENVAHLNLLRTFEPHLGEKLVVNKYDAHPNEYANQLAADAIYFYLFQNK